MKRFILKTLVFLIIPILSIKIFDFWLLSLDSLYKEKERQITSYAHEIEVLILGNSHNHYGIKPQEFDLFTFNAANVNQSLYFDRRITTKHIDSLVNLKFVLIGIDYHSFYFSSQGIRDYWSYLGHGITYRNKLYVFERLSPFIFGFTPSISFKILKDYFYRKKKYKKERFLEYNVENGVSILDSCLNGFLGRKGTDIQLFNSLDYKKRVDYFNNIISLSTEKDEILMDIEHLITELQNNNIKPILVTSPKFTDYNKFYNQKILEQNKKEINYLISKYNIEHWDYLNDKRFEISNFYDYDHLNISGAEKFSKILNSRLRKSFYNADSN